MPVALDLLTLKRAKETSDCVNFKFTALFLLRFYDARVLSLPGNGAVEAKGQGVVPWLPTIKGGLRS